ncbi:MAG: hypothetical protein PHE17_07330 [Thiothrix sp.]|uniref:major capsid protein n=1 Tax=Thiothrix sp. TaxID=1032 RepID=UPI0026334B86|nr:major capsid protein [Thiothrix sp.]MDD5392816.1 hypothetical protein [Thiothrix sp.]
MKPMNVMKKYGAKVFGVFAGATGLVTAANADYMTDIQSSVTTAQTNALTVGGYVLAAVAALIVISLIMKLIHKV